MGRQTSAPSYIATGVDVDPLPILHAGEGCLLRKGDSAGRKKSMRVLVVFITGLALIQTAFADDVSQSFDGKGSGDTPAFNIGDRWEAQWNGPPCNVSVEWEDGTVLVGSSAMGPGSIYVSKGGTYKLHVGTRGNMPWHVKVVTLGPAGSPAVAGGMPFYFPPDMPDASMNAPSGTTSSFPSPMTPATPTSTPSAPPASPLAPVKLTDAQTRALVLIKGDNAEGTGFLVKTAAGPVVVTNQHVIAGNPHLQITTTTGQTIKTMGLQGASDRDLAMIAIQDNNYSYLEMGTDLGGTVQTGDQVVTPGNSQGGEVMLSTPGTVLALGPQRVEISNPIYHGNSGGPILHVKSGKVIGVVTEAMQVDTSNALDKASFSNQNSAISGQMRYFGLRLDSVPHWDGYSWQRFNNESLFLSQFHERSKCLDSYLNTGAKDMSEWGLYYLKDEKVKAANEHLSDMATGGDSSQRMEAWRNLIFELTAVADTNLSDIENLGNFYSFDQIQAKQEAAYREHLKKEIDDMSNDLSRAASLARRNN
jgi:hypothetical protein